MTFLQRPPLQRRPPCHLATRHFNAKVRNASQTLLTVLDSGPHGHLGHLGVTLQFDLVQLFLWESVQSESQASEMNNLNIKFENTVFYTLASLDTLATLESLCNLIWCSSFRSTYVQSESQAKWIQCIFNIKFENVIPKLQFRCWEWTSRISL